MMNLSNIIPPPSSGDIGAWPLGVRIEWTTVKTRGQNHHHGNWLDTQSGRIFNCKDAILAVRGALGTGPALYQTAEAPSAAGLRGRQSTSVLC